MMAPFIENSRNNGLKFPEGYWAQHRPEQITAEDYKAARWIAKPANLFDNDLPIMVSAAYLYTTAERAQDMAQKPVYILNHVLSDGRPRSLAPTLDEVEAETACTGRKIYEGAGISAADLSFENLYDGFPQFHQSTLKAWAIAASGSATRSISTKATSAFTAPTPSSRAAATSAVGAAASGCIPTASSSCRAAPAQGK